MSKLLLAVALCATMAGGAHAEPARVEVATAAIAPTTLDARTRALHRDTIQRVLATAEPRALQARHFDVSVDGFTMAIRGEDVEITAQVRVAISDARGKLVSIVRGGASSLVPRATFRATQITSYRRDALVAATRTTLGRALRERLPR